MIYRHIQHNRSTQTLSPDQSMSVLSLKSPRSTEAEFMHAVVTGTLSSTASHTAQGSHSSHKQPLLAACTLVVPHCLLQLLSLPELLSQSHPAPHPSALAMLGSAVGQTLTQQGHSLKNRQRPATVAQEQVSLHVKEIQTPSVLSRASNILQDTQTFSSPQNLPLGTVLLPFAQSRGGTAQEHATHAASAY